MQKRAIGPRRIRAPWPGALVALALAPFLAGAAHATIIYDIGSIALSNGYTATGTITTDGTLGAIGQGNIVAVAVDVAGARPTASPWPLPVCR